MNDKTIKRPSKNILPLVIFPHIFFHLFFHILGETVDGKDLTQRKKGKDMQHNSQKPQAPQYYLFITPLAELSPPAHVNCSVKE